LNQKNNPQTIEIILKHFTFIFYFSMGSNLSPCKFLWLKTNLLNYAAAQWKFFANGGLKIRYVCRLLLLVCNHFAKDNL